LNSSAANKKWIEKDLEELSPALYFFSVRALADDQVIGEIVLDVSSWNARNGFVGISIGERENWGKGLGTEAVRLLCRYAFDELNLHRVALSTYAINERGVRLYARVGFKIVGDARTPLGVGILVAGNGVSVVDVEVSGAATAAIAFARDSSATLVGSDIHNNPGAALVIEAGAAPRITHSMFGRNGMSPRTPATFAIDAAAMPLFQRNVFVGVRPDVFASLSRAAREALQRDNWFH